MLGSQRWQRYSLGGDRWQLRWLVRGSELLVRASHFSVTFSLISLSGSGFSVNLVLIRYPEGWARHVSPVVVPLVLVNLCRQLSGGCHKQPMLNLYIIKPLKRLDHIQVTYRTSHFLVHFHSDELLPGD